MRKGRKSVVCLLMVCLFVALSCPVYASDLPGQSKEISTRNTNIKYNTVSLSFSGGNANCSASVTGYSSNTNHVSIYLYLQKYNGGWTNVAQWSGSANSYTMSLNKLYPVTSGTYRLKASFYAESENIVKYSSERVY